jgi:hypothetical protein
MDSLQNLKMLFLACFILTASCTQKGGSNEIKTSETTAVKMDSLASYQLNLIEYPKAFLAANELEDWEEFETLHESLERLKELNFNGIEVDLIALFTRVKGLRTAPFPEKFEIPQIKSRLKVVEMQVQKARYFTKHYKADSLLPSIELIYTYYNRFVERMVSVNSENQDFGVALDSTSSN